MGHPERRGAFYNSSGRRGVPRRLQSGRPPTRRRWPVQGPRLGCDHRPGCAGRPAWRWVCRVQSRWQAPGERGQQRTPLGRSGPAGRTRLDGPGVAFPNVPLPILTFSPNGRRLAAVYRDGRVEVWDTTDGRTLHKFQTPPKNAILPGVLKPRARCASARTDSSYYGLGADLRGNAKGEPGIWKPEPSSGITPYQWVRGKPVVRRSAPTVDGWPPVRRPAVPYNDRGERWPTAARENLPSRPGMVGPRRQAPVHHRLIGRLLGL